MIGCQSSTSKIPNELCQQIFNYEFEIDIGNITEQNIAVIIELYSQAINFLLSKMENPQSNHKKLKFYQDKIKRLLARNDVQKCLMGQKIDPKIVDFQHKLEGAQGNVEEQKKALILHFKNQEKTQQKLIQKTVEQQNKTLKERIERRSRSKMRKMQSPRKIKILIEN